MAYRYVKRWSASLIIRKIDIKSIIRYDLTPVEMTIIKKTRVDKCCRGCGEKGTSVRCWQECKMVQPVWRTVWRFIKK